MTRSLRSLPFALLVGLALASCAKKSAEREGTMSPDAGGAEAVGPADIDALEAQLAAREDQLRALGAPPPGEAAGAATGQTAGRDLPVAAEAGGDASEVQSGGPQVAPTSAAADPSAEKSNRHVPANRCETVCELSSAICQLQDQICGLAPRHEGEPRYQRACDRATGDCTFATEACHACS